MSKPKSRKNAPAEVLPVKPPDSTRDSELEKINDLLPDWAPKIPFHLLVAGPTMSGKTSIIIKLLVETYRGIFDRIVIFSPTFNSDDCWHCVKIKRGKVFDEGYSDEALKELFEQQRATNQTRAENGKRKQLSLYIFDDVLGQIRPSSFANRTFIARARHEGISTIWTTQQSKGLPPTIRTNVRQRIFINNLSKEMRKSLGEALLDEKTAEIVDYLQGCNCSRFNFAYVDEQSGRRSINFDGILKEKTEWEKKMDERNNWRKNFG